MIYTPETSLEELEAIQEFIDNDLRKGREYRSFYEEVDDLVDQSVMIVV